MFCYRKLTLFGILISSFSFADTASDTIYKQRQSTPTQSKDEQPYFLSDLYAHNPIYLLPYYRSFSKVYDNNIATETKFQLSFRIPITSIKKKHFFYFAYTQTSFFQNYNKADSRPFRDIDYAPELYFSYKTSSKMLQEIRLGHKHTSNGEREARSRTQNQILLSLRFASNLNTQIKMGAVMNLWLWTGTHRDNYLHDNPDLARYRGNADLMLYISSPKHLFEAQFTPLIPNYNFNYNFFKPKLVLGYTYKFRTMGIYVQYTNGYGDNIYEYNIYSNRIGIGIRLLQNL